MKRILLSGFGALLLALGSVAQADVVLFDSCLDVDGSFSNLDGADCPLGGSQTGLDANGLGTVTVNVSGAGSHYVSLFVDHEIDEEDNTFFNEIGAATGAPAACLRRIPRVRVPRFRRP